MMTTDKKIVIFLMGATASGKTDLAIKISERLKTRIISVDSAMIYRGMRVGVAKPDEAILAKYPHSLIDICEPDEAYSAFDFASDAAAEIEAAFAANQVPLLVGGTSFYFRALEYGLSDLPQSSPQSKAKFEGLLAEVGSVKLHQELAKIDEKAAKRIHQNDQQRIIRALEVFDLSGKTLSELQGQKKPLITEPIKKIILLPPKNELLKNIKTRFLKMLDDGFLDEVKGLMQNPKLSPKCPSIRSVGYRQAWQFLSGEIDEKEMLERAIIATNQLAKRQKTWLKKEQNALHLTTQDLQTALNFINL